jgi:hypothetical protein
MNPNLEILIEGSYLYYEDGKHYADESFKLIKNQGSQNFTFLAEILSRLKTGEFLKLLVKYEINQYFTPIYAKVEKSVGNRFAIENYSFDPTSMEMHYLFESAERKQEYKKNLTPKHYLTSPAFCTSGIFTLSKKFDSSARTSISLFNSENDWSYVGHPSDKVVYVDHKLSDVSELNINGINLNASLFRLYQYDSGHQNASSEEPVDLFLSKYYGIPYQLLHGRKKIIIKFLKKNDN